MASKCCTMRTVSIKTVSEAEHLVLAVSRRSDAWAWWRTTCDARGPETMSTWTQSSGKANIRRGGAVESLVTKIWSDCQIFMRKIFSCKCSHSCPPSFLPSFKGTRHSDITFLWHCLSQSREAQFYTSDWRLHPEGGDDWWEEHRRLRPGVSVAGS